MLGGLGAWVQSRLGAPFHSIPFICVICVICVMNKKAAKPHIPHAPKPPSPQAQALACDKQSRFYEGYIAPISNHNVIEDGNAD